MRVLICLLFLFLFSIEPVFAYDLVLPTAKKTTVSSNYAFFVGKAGKSEEITINDEKIYVASNGAFAHSVKLKDGENRIAIKSEFNTQVYKVFKKESIPPVKTELREFDAKLYKIKKNNTPLRATPIDFGMNRITHLFKDTYILINGENGDFYRVLLSDNKLAWVDKKAVYEVRDNIFPKFIEMKSESYKNASKFFIEFSEKLPYVVEENEKEILFKVYNPIISNSSVYTVNIRKPEKYSYKTVLEGGKYVFKITDVAKSVIDSYEDLTVVVDAGHGGLERGAIGCLGDEEKDLNLAIALELKKVLSDKGINVILTREDDKTVSLDDRVELAQENDANIFVSIHLNSIPDIKMDINKHKGTSVYYYNSNSKNLAKTLLKTVTEALGTRKDGIRTASFAVLRPTDYLGVLVEVAYMTNPIDSTIYTTENFAEITAQAIADGILQYIDSL